MMHGTKEIGQSPPSTGSFVEEISLRDKAHSILTKAAWGESSPSLHAASRLSSSTKGCGFQANFSPASLTQVSDLGEGPFQWQGMPRAHERCEEHSKPWIKIHSNETRETGRQGV